ncbi:Os12g0576732 [Oryza sativa Japonica Group]|uniref:Os12g0576732 protein n=1 Tax=Oryza sativa subsp. japonica TaxID=39947 RepID=A0A0P0YBY3_ORYSJ|nr:hypothetical protein EE612_060465 [Oryza sativa]BAT17780.1 Os12g0576732 [Oryza sativa Japonica Group]
MTTMYARTTHLMAAMIKNLICFSSSASPCKTTEDCSCSKLAQELAGVGLILWLNKSVERRGNGQCEEEEEEEAS